MNTPTKKELDDFIASCIAKGWSIKSITHPKSKIKFYGGKIESKSKSA